MGWTTNVTEYSKANTIPASISVTMITTNAHIRTSMSSAVSGGRWGFRGLAGLFSSTSSRSFNLLLQYRGYKVIRTILAKQTIRTLTPLLWEVFGILTIIPIAVFTCY
jgi:hypothetical protein